MKAQKLKKKKEGKESSRDGLWDAPAKERDEQWEREMDQERVDS